jgi:hypothetical protein
MGEKQIKFLIEAKRLEIKLLEKELKSLALTPSTSTKVQYEDAVKVNHQTVNKTPEQVFVEEHYSRKEMLKLLPYEVSYTTLNRRLEDITPIKRIRRVNQSGKGKEIFARQDVIKATSEFWSNVQYL